MAALADSMLKGIEGLWYSSVLLPVILGLFLVSLALQFRSLLFGLKAGLAIHGDQEVQRALQKTASIRARASRVLSHTETAFDVTEWLPSVPTFDFSSLHAYVVEPLNQCMVRGDADVEVQEEVRPKYDTRRKLRPFAPRLRKTAPDFSGDWLLNSVEGDVEEVAYNAGLSKAKRLASAALGWGAGIVRVTIKHEGDQLHMTSSTPLGSGQAQFIIGNGAQWATASDGGRYQCDLQWEGTAIACTNYRGGVESRQRRFLRKDSMVIETLIDGYYPQARSMEVYVRSAR